MHSMQAENILAANIAEVISITQRDIVEAVITNLEEEHWSEMRVSLDFKKGKGV